MPYSSCYQSGNTMYETCSKYFTAELFEQRISLHFNVSILEETCLDCARKATDIIRYLSCISLIIICHTNAQEKLEIRGRDETTTIAQFIREHSTNLLMD